MNNQLPKYPLKFFRWFCDPDFVEDIEGDLRERFAKRLKDHKPARRLFFFDVIKLFRPGIIRTPNFISNINYMGTFRHNIKSAMRGFNRYRTSFLINLVGLSSGLASSLLIFLWVNQELSMDQFYPNKDRMYQVLQNIQEGSDQETLTNTPALLGQALAEEFPEVKTYASVLPVGSYGSEGIASYKDISLKANEEYASPQYLEFFSYPMRYGDAKHALDEVSNVVLSKDFSDRMFGEGENPMGQIIEWTVGDSTGSYYVTGVVDQLPALSSRKFDLVFTLEAFLHQYPHIRKWGNSDPSTFIEVHEGTNTELLDGKIRDFIATKAENYPFTLFLQKYSDRYLYGQYENGQPVAGRMKQVNLFSSIAGLILVIACINFMNLSTARASRRLKEIGVKKTFGASRFILGTQYLTESFIVTLISLFFALLILQLAIPFFNELMGYRLVWDFSVDQLSIMVGLLIGTTLLAGSYPAAYLSGFSPGNIFKGKLSGSKGDRRARQGLVIFQFTISIVLITSVFIVSSQLDFIQSKNLGFKKDNILYFNRDGNIGTKGNSFIHELRDIPGVINAGTFGHDLLGGRGTTTGVSWTGKDPEEKIRFGNLEVGYNLIETFGMELVEGRTFSPDFGDESSKILFNEKAIALMGLENPIGQRVNLWGRDREIIGVVKDFHFESLHNEIRPCFFQYATESSSLVVRIDQQNPIKTIESIEKLYSEYNPDLAFDFHFFDREYEELYRSEIHLVNLSRTFTFIAIVISCLGLLGLVSFTIERRQKEIGIRKVLGSSITNLILLLNREFSLMIGIAILIATPLGFVLMKKWLEDFSYRIDLSVWAFLIPILLVFLIAGSMVSLQAYRASIANPVDSLKDE